MRKKMKSVAKFVHLPALAFALYGCGGSSNEICKNPVEFGNERNSTTFGYIVVIEESIDAATEAARLMEKHDDLEVFSVFSIINAFHADSSDATLEYIRCEPAVASLTYNNADAPY